MKLDITKTNIKYNNYSGFTIQDSLPESYQGRPRLLETFNPSYAFKSNVKTKTMPSEIELQNFTSEAFLNQKPSKQSSHDNRRLLIAAVFHFVHPEEKYS